MEGAHAALGGWESFYVIVGSSGAALTGLQFVVVTLIADVGTPASGQSIAAFGTPTVVHFCAALLVSAILSAPWQALSSAAVALGGCGVAGIVYAALVARRARHQTEYKPVLEDWMWYIILPLAAYATILVAAFTLPRSATSALFAVAAGTLLLLFVGIHNAWDTVTYVAFEHRREQRGGEG